ncbi:hypothetical protein RvVAR0630_10210 [Agrobacterium vitis]|nr:hypothetical protein RvVAR0630_10210 [Agrobacterium vitis]
MLSADLRGMVASMEPDRPSRYFRKSVVTNREYEEQETSPAEATGQRPET